MRDTAKPDAAFAGAAERFLELIGAFWAEAARSGDHPQDLSSVARTLSEQFKRWLQASCSAHPWYGSGAGSTAEWSALAFGALQLGPRSDHVQDSQRMLELMTRFAQLQAQLAMHWSEIASTSGQQFAARLSTSSIGGLKFESVMKLYELWIECAEQAYASTVRKDDFCRVQAELANTTTALLLEQRKHAETLARAFGMPARTEMDALHRRVKKLEGELRTLRSRPEGEGPDTKRKRASRSRRRRT